MEERLPERPRVPHLPCQNPRWMSEVPADQIGIKIVHQSGSTVDNDVDIVAVHGLGAIPALTWREKQSGVNWIEDGHMLLRQIPTARIMTFGYDSVYVGKNPVLTSVNIIASSFLGSLEAKRRDVKRRPVIFIGHCFGGLVVERAILLSKLRGTDVVQATKGVVFLGTPHRGSATFKEQGELMATIASAVAASPSDDKLRIESDVLTALTSIRGKLVEGSQDFARLCIDKRIQVRCFFETRITDVGRLVGRTDVKEFVVDEASACLDGQPSFGLNVDHFALNKFASPDDGNFRSICEQMVQIYELATCESDIGSDRTAEELRRLLRDPILAQQNVRSNYVETFFEVPLDTNKRFVQRKSAMNALENLFGFAPMSNRGGERVALVGMGGCGKTEIALRFAENHRTDYNAVFWVDCSNETLFTNGLVRISELLTPSGRPPAVPALRICQNWLVAQQDWLLIVDNFDENTIVESFRTSFLRGGMRGSILFTSRNTSLAAFWDVVEVGDLTTDEGHSLLRNIIGSSNFQDFNERELDDLLFKLGNLALAIDQAGSYILQQKVSIEEYRKLLDLKRKRLLSQTSSRSHAQEARGSVWTTWALSYEKLQKTHFESSRLLSFLSLLDRDSITLEVLTSKEPGQRHWSKEGEFIPVEENEEWIVKDLVGLFSSRIEMREAMTILNKYSFIRWGSQQGQIGMHPLVQYWAYDRLCEDESDAEAMKRCAIGVVSSRFEKQDLFPPTAIPSSWGTEGEERSLGLWPWRRYQELLVHASKCLEYAHEVKTMTPVIASRSLALLQVLEYPDAEIIPTYGAKVAITAKTLDSVARSFQRADDQEDEFLRGSIAVWRLVQSHNCQCRKDPGNRCHRCSHAYSELINFNNKHRDSPRSRRLRALLLNVSNIFIISEPSFRDRYEEDYDSEGDDDEVIFRHPALMNGTSWIETYAYATWYYYRDVWWNGTGSIWNSDQYRVYAHPSRVSEIFSLLLPDSEEVRRSLWYSTRELWSGRDWSAIVEKLSPLVEQSISNPQSGWSHERCIIRLVVALLRLKRRPDAIRVVARAREAYEKRGMFLRALQTSLPRVTREPEYAKTLQIFVRDLRGISKMLQVHSNASIQDLWDVFENKGGYPGYAEGCRLLYGGKQLEADRFLSDYGIGNEATLHLVLRMLGGRSVDAFS